MKVRSSVKQLSATKTQGRIFLLYSAQGDRYKGPTISALLNYMLKSKMG